MERRKQKGEMTMPFEKDEGNVPKSKELRNSGAKYVQEKKLTQRQALLIRKALRRPRTQAPSPPNTNVGDGSGGLGGLGDRRRPPKRLSTAIVDSGGEIASCGGPGGREPTRSSEREEARSTMVAATGEGEEVVTFASVEATEGATVAGEAVRTTSATTPEAATQGEGGVVGGTGVTEGETAGTGTATPGPPGVGEGGSETGDCLPPLPAATAAQEPATGTPTGVTSTKRPGEYRSTLTVYEPVEDLRRRARGKCSERASTSKMYAEKFAEPL